MNQKSPWSIALPPRDPSEEHRVSTSLELFFDLVFVVAISFAASALHHEISADQLIHGIVSFLLVFFAIWLAWINFTWFASAYDSDSIPYRLLVFVQMTGALVLAAGVPDAFDHRDFDLVIIGYVIMRLAMVTQWLLVYRHDPDHEQAALRYAVGIAVIQVGWVLWGIYADDFALEFFLVLALAELVVPFWAERSTRTTWHHEHLIERYGLFTIIVLGESILSASLAIQAAVDLKNIEWRTAANLLGGLVIVFAIWWMYFGFRDEEGPSSFERGFLWGYGHYAIWASIASVGVGISVVVDFTTHHSEITKFQSGMALAIPIAIFLVCMWLIHDLTGASSIQQQAPMLIGAILVLIAPLTDLATLMIGLVLVGIIVVRSMNQGYRHL